MKAPLKASIIFMGCFLFVPALYGQYGQVKMQGWCARKVANDMESTRKERPAVFATISNYLFEWSKSRQACVIVIQYRTEKDGRPMIQILATNAITMQPMEGYKNVFLVPKGGAKQIEDATNLLFEKYSH